MAIERVLLQDFINDVCVLIDKGYKIEISAINIMLENKQIPDQFRGEYSFAKVEFKLQSHMFTDENWDMLQTLLEQSYYGYSNSHSFGISNNGMLYLIALANSHLRMIFNN